ncbi:hypothetical protein LOTGIDRAFT_202347 [Lottia gigantea]|uniref:Uncharacterized protein n=1 Tax=Lottia gigantea TaxID=225164 RepID=V4ALA7_LOTGI|nr:hypothetical protein LOTGIDRAFT_202347 [Lottia gigantea]ESO95545.1 hypothetical protein LOTGIDRAFT_202347 [Lottia gigantea]
MTIRFGRFISQLGPEKWDVKNNILSLQNIVTRPPVSKIQIQNMVSYFSSLYL